MSTVKKKQQKRSFHKREGMSWGKRAQQITNSLLKLNEEREDISTSIAERKARALMIVIGKIIARYQNQHAGNLDKKIFELHNTAKGIDFAKTEDELRFAITDL